MSGEDQRVGATREQPERRRADFDVSKPSTARMYDFYLGGKDNYPADREAAQQVVAHWPGVRDAARNNRAFLVRAVRFLAERGVDQYIDLGSGIPTSPNVHEVAREVIPDARVVYVDSDPVVSAHTRAIRATHPGVVAVEADLTDTDAILDDPYLLDTIDLERPVAVLAFAALHFVPMDVGQAVVDRWRETIAAGSYLAVSAVALLKPVRAEELDEATEIYDKTAASVTVRTPDQFTDLLAGFDPVDPGLVDPAKWRADETPAQVPMLAGVGLRR